MDTTDISKAFGSDGFYDLTQPVDVNIKEPDISAYYAPFLANQKAWDQYHNEYLYQVEKKLRAFIEEASKNPSWKKAVNRTFMYSQLFELVMGRPYGSDEDDPKYTSLISRVFAYYSIKVTANYYDRKTKRQRSKTGYRLSATRLNNPPWSLKLRLEWFADNGIVPNGLNMKPEYKDLKKGHHRIPKCEDTMQKRREEGRRRYEQRQSAIAGESEEHDES